MQPAPYVDVPAHLEGFPDEIDAGPGRPRSAVSRVHAASARRGRVSRPQHVERLAKERWPGAAAANDPIARQDSLTLPLHGVSRSCGLERFPDEGEVRAPEGGTSALTGSKVL